MREIEKLVPPGAAPRPAFDRMAALERLGGDAELLAEVATLFRTDGPRLMGEIKQALGRGEAAAAGKAAHGLKGAVGYLGAAPAQEAALRLERLGAAGDQAGATAALPELEAEVQRLLTALDQI